MECSATLVPSWGDGSGMGTGGMLGLPDCPLQMWMGQWSPVVYSYSSNWKELKTLLLTLRHLRQTATLTVHGMTVFYFTNNSTTYWIAASGFSSSPGLHTLVEEIGLLELELGCQLQVVHVPSMVLIQQGTDGLSCSVWSTILHDTLDQANLPASIFAPLVPDPMLAEALTKCLGYQAWHHQSWDMVWHTCDLFDKLTVWFPPPELAQQAITFALEAWVEHPLTTSFIFFVPRVIPAFWQGLLQYILELPLLRPMEPWLPMLPIPIVVLYLPPHVHTISVPHVHRLGLPTNADMFCWHMEQAEHMRRLPLWSLN